MKHTEGCSTCNNEGKHENGAQTIETCVVRHNKLTFLVIYSVTKAGRVSLLGWLGKNGSDCSVNNTGLKLMILVTPTAIKNFNTNLTKAVFGMESEPTINPLGGGVEAEEATT
jgi:hypothetical protein